MEAHSAPLVEIDSGRAVTLVVFVLRQHLRGWDRLADARSRRDGDVHRQPLDPADADTHRSGRHEVGVGLDVLGQRVGVGGTGPRA